MSLINPTVSVLIPSYNHGEFIEAAVRSVWDQNCEAAELIVVDDGSTDNSRDLLERLAILSPIEMKVFYQKNSGICASLNRALSEASGKIIAILASDDIMAPSRINQELEYFKISPSLKVFFSNGKFLKEGKCYGDLHKDMKRFLLKGTHATRDYLLTTAPGLYSQARLIQRDFLLELGGFDEETGSDDWSLHIRIFNKLQLNGEFLFVDRVSFLYRVHESQMHRTGDFMSVMKRKVVRKYFPLQNRAKILCEIYVKVGISRVCRGRFHDGWRYLSMAKKIAFTEGIPVHCILNLGRKIPPYLFRKFLSI